MKKNELKNLPYQGRFHKSPSKQYQETILITHNYAGHQRAFGSHVKWLNQIGFDVVTYNLSPRIIKPRDYFAFTKDGSFGVRHVWARQAQTLLDFIPGDKILFSFSFPGVSALEASYLRQHQDIKAMVFDSGPFVHVAQCGYRLQTDYFKEPSLLMRLFSAGFGCLILGTHRYTEHVQQYFDSMQEGFPILSIRGWQDNLVPVNAIEGFFALSKKADIQVLSLADAKHLDGIKVEEELYKTRVERFLKRYAVLFT